VNRYIKIHIKHTPTLKITLPYKALPNSILSSTTSIGNISIFKIKHINSVGRSIFTSACLLYSLFLKLCSFHIFHPFPTLNYFPITIKYFQHIITQFQHTSNQSNHFQSFSIQIFPFHIHSNQIIHFPFTQSIYLPFLIHIFSFIKFFCGTKVRQCLFNIFLYFSLLFL